METHEHVSALARESSRFAALMASADFAARVPTCPDWTVFELATHVGGLWHWAAHLLEHRVVVETWRSSLDLAYPAPPGIPSEVTRFLETGSARLSEACEQIDPDAATWTWGADQHARFWPRRMLFETLVHRVDGELAAGTLGAIEEGLAVEGIDEHLENLPATARWSAAIDGLRGPRARLGFMTPDASWCVRLGANGFTWDRSRPAGADTTVTGTAADVYLVLLRRCAVGERGTLVAGDGDLLERFLASTSF